jgi:hypothetical protein
MGSALAKECSCKYQNPMYSCLDPLIDHRRHSVSRKICAQKKYTAMVQVRIDPGNGWMILMNRDHRFQTTSHLYFADQY